MEGAFPPAPARTLDKRPAPCSDRPVQRRRATALLVASGAAAVLASPAAGAGLRVRDELSWTRADGTVVAFGPQIRVWCGPWTSDVRVPSIHVRIGQRTPAGDQALWELHAVVADVKRHPLVRLPNSFVFDEPRGAQLFAVDGANELSSETDDSAGRIRFDRVRCGRRMRFAFSVRGRVGSEFSDGEALRVRGSFRASMSPG
jgi:hypothetical protein